MFLKYVWENYCLMCNQSSITLINDENSNYFSNEFCNYAARTGKAMKLQHMWWKRDKIIMGLCANCHFELMAVGV